MQQIISLIFWGYNVQVCMMFIVICPQVLIKDLTHTKRKKNKGKNK